MNAVTFVMLMSHKRLGQRVVSVHEILRNASNTSQTRSLQDLNASNALTNDGGEKYVFCACVQIFYLTNVRELMLTNASNALFKRS